jgi:hypothetical protein
MPRRSTRERREPDRYKAGINSVTATDNKQLLGLKTKLLVFAELVKIVQLEPDEVANVLLKLASN